LCVCGASGSTDAAVPGGALPYMILLWRHGEH